MSGPSGSGEDAADHNVEVWKIKRLIKSLEMARGYDVCSIFDTWVICLRKKLGLKLFKMK